MNIDRIDWRYIPGGVGEWFHMVVFVDGSSKLYTTREIRDQLGFAE